MLAESEEFTYSLKSIIDSAKDWTKQIYKEKSLFTHILPKHNVSTLLESGCFKGDRLLGLIPLITRGVGLEKEFSLYDKALEKTKDTSIHVLDAHIQEYTPKSQLGFPERYDAILLMDNQLAKHANQDNLKKVLDSANILLNSNGIMILEIFNYNKVLKEEYYDFSKVPFMLEGKKLYMTRHMKIFDEDILKYLVDIYDSAGHHLKSFTELHLILTKRRIEEWLNTTGFRIDDMFGDHEMNDFDVDRSSKMIVIARKTRTIDSRNHIEQR